MQPQRFLNIFEGVMADHRPLDIGIQLDAHRCVIDLVVVGRAHRSQPQSPLACVPRHTPTSPKPYERIRDGLPL